MQISNGNFINHDIKDVFPFEDNCLMYNIYINIICLTNEIELQKVVSEIKQEKVKIAQYF